MPKDILEYFDMCIRTDYMMGVLITSAAEGLTPSIGLDYGVGKSTLAGQLVQPNIVKYGKDDNGNHLGQRMEDGTFRAINRIRLFEFLPKCPEMYISILGTIKQGSIACPLFEAFQTDGLELRLDRGD